MEKKQKKVTTKEMNAKMEDLKTEASETVDKLIPERMAAYKDLYDKIDDMTSSSLKRVLKFGMAVPFIKGFDVESLSKYERDLVENMLKIKDIDTQLAFASIFYEEDSPTTKEDVVETTSETKEE